MNLEEHIAKVRDVIAKAKECNRLDDGTGGLSAARGAAKRRLYTSVHLSIPSLLKILEGVEALERLEQQWRDEMEVINDFTGEAAITRRTVLLCADKIREALNLGGMA